MSLLVGLTGLGLLCWVGLLLLRPRFWRGLEHFEPDAIGTSQGEDVPTTGQDALQPVVAVIPARDEAAGIGTAVTSLLSQHRADSPVHVIVVDDGSTDGTADVAKTAAQALGGDASERLTVLQGAPLQSGWSGKLWAVQQGLDHLQSLQPPPRWILLTDGDIDHAPGSVTGLRAMAERDGLILVSLMVRLRNRSFWERLMIPPFVFFFRMLYPFDQVNDPRAAIAAAAGGCMLIRQTALQRIGGMRAIRGALIDDCSLAARLKRDGPVKLMTTTASRSLRRSDHLADIWQMVSRTAYAQLYHNPFMLLGTVIGLVLLYGMGPVAILFGLIGSDFLAVVLGSVLWAIPAVLVSPTERQYGQSRLWGLAMPVIAGLYMVMTVDSARAFHWGGGNQWKGRRYDHTGIVPSGAAGGDGKGLPLIDGQGVGLSPLDDPHRHAESVTRQAGSSFYGAMRLLPPPQRYGMFALYAFCRIVDDIADEPGEEQEKRAALTRWRADIDAVYAALDQTPVATQGNILEIPLAPEYVHPVAKALMVPIARNGLRKADFLAVIDGMETDAAPAVRIPDMAALELYCDQVACAVGRLTNGICGVSKEIGDPLATAQGLALQFTNILRDVAEDADRDRIYLPAAELAAQGVADPSDPRSVLTDPATKVLCAQLLLRAEEYFAEADRLQARADRRLMRPALVMKEVYRRYAQRLHRRGWADLRQPVVVSKAQKAVIALRYGVFG